MAVKRMLLKSKCPFSMLAATYLRFNLNRSCSSQPLNFSLEVRVHVSGCLLVRPVNFACVTAVQRSSGGPAHA